MEHRVSRNLAWYTELVIMQEDGPMEMAAVVPGGVRIRARRHGRHDQGHFH